MHKIKVLWALALLGLIAISCGIEPVSNGITTADLKIGDDKLTGTHYNLNIIGVKDKSMNDIDAGHVIFVDLFGDSSINLQKGDDFAVLDKNGTDEDGALFQLPDPGFEPYVTELPYGFDTTTDYSVYARPLGKPMTGSVITTMANLSDYGWEILDKHGERVWENIMNNYDVISLTWGDFIPNPVEFERLKGKQEWQNVTAELLSVVYEIVITYDSDPDPNVVVEEEITLHVRIPIFNEILEGEYWKYNNNGLKLLQLRFYPFGTDVTYDDLANGWDSI